MKSRYELQRRVTSLLAAIDADESLTLNEREEAKRLLFAELDQSITRFCIAFGASYEKTPARCQTRR